jgi:hypothetical protein
MNDLNFHRHIAGVYTEVAHFLEWILETIQEYDIKA